MNVRKTVDRIHGSIRFRAWSTGIFTGMLGGLAPDLGWWTLPVFAVAGGLSGAITSWLCAHLDGECVTALAVAKWSKK